MLRWLVTCSLALACALPSFARAAHAYAQFGDIKYPAGFAHFDWVNPKAPKGGDFSLVPPLRITNFDKYNPFTLKGISPPGLGTLMFETLLTGTLDEPATAYGLLAEDIDVAVDKLSVTFRLHPQARFNNGEPVMAADVKHSFDMLMSKQASPQYRVRFNDVKQAVVLAPRAVRFDFNTTSAELPMLVGGIPVFSRSWGKGKPFDQIVTDEPISSGPYKVGRVNFGRDITYQRDPKYWGADLNVRRGIFNFDRVTYKIYKDTTAQAEAFKAGEFDYIQVFRPLEWARVYKGKKFDSGELIRKELQTKNAGDFQGFMINSRREKFKDLRVREALGLALDFEWINRRLSYNSRIRVNGYFDSSDFEAKDKPEGDELAVLESLRGKLPAKIFDEEVPRSPSNSAPGGLRENLLKAKKLLADAGWTYRDGALRNAKGEAFEFEHLDSGGQERELAPYIQALAKLGIRLKYRKADFALINKRLDVYDYDFFTVRVPGRESPGSELLDRFGSKSVDVEGGSNLLGVRDPNVDYLLNLAISATTRPELVARLRALDRVLRHGFYVVPQWHVNYFRVAYRSGKFEQPSVAPSYYQAEDWIVRTWWSKEPKR
jgi:microcin C transport system substrate-binding protein